MTVFTNQQVAEEAAWKVARDSGDAELRKAGWLVYRAAVQARTAVKAAAVPSTTEKKDITVVITDTDVTDAEALDARVTALGKKATKADLFSQVEVLHYLLAEAKAAVTKVAKVENPRVPFGTDAASAAHRAFVVLYKDHAELWFSTLSTHKLMVEFSTYVRTHGPGHRLTAAQHGKVAEKYALLSVSQKAVCVAYATQCRWVK